ncbi:hypothetical protein G6L37_06790 [Agrobacterium rubi]|nr:hypothetical protein [Agrobacterium rubi]NTF25071.1 hypothetical protein [Agrobacterium rubi]
MPGSDTSDTISFSKLKIGRKSHRVSDMAEAVRLFEEARGEKGSSVMPDGLLFDDTGVQVAYISYNGRIWAGTDYVAGADCLYPPKSA